jgi:FtsP/CotA-like multicopper oxidase with cupredoxin domain
LKLPCVCILAIAALFAPLARAAHDSSPVCPRPAVGAIVPEPEDLRSQGGTLKVTLTYRNFVEADGEIGYCYLYRDGSEAPTLRLKPGDWLILTLKNDLVDLHAPVAAGSPASSAAPALKGMPGMTMDMSHAPCGGGSPMGATATNLHFHGITVPPVCHQDDVLHTAIDPSAAPFEYKFQIPADEPPGLYWYHPHIHGFTKVQVLGGASGALIVEGIERAEPVVAGLPERVLIVRDQDLVHPDAPVPGIGGLVAPAAMLDQDGDVQNNGSGTGKPAKDLSLNFVPASFPDYRPGVIRMKPGETQFWRVLNASAITYLNLQIVSDGLPAQMQVVAMDGIPLGANGQGAAGFIWLNHIGLPPGGRAEFVMKAPAQGNALLLTRSVNTGSAGENDPVRPLARIVTSADAAEPASILAANPQPLPRSSTPWLGNTTPVRTRKLYFTEKAQDPSDPNSPTTFMLTVDGQPEMPYDPHSTAPNIIARQGDVEDWIIENRTQELHAFHIHQVHFMLVQWFGLPVSEPYLRDTINVPFWDGKSPFYPSVKIRVDFRDPNSVGTFMYHCHLLEHEDGGMMGTIRVDPPDVPAKEGAGH